MMSQNQLITHGTTTTVGNIHLSKAKPWRQETSRTAHAQTRLSVREKGGKLSLGVFMIPLRKKNSLYYYISTISDTIQYLLGKIVPPTCLRNGLRFGAAPRKRCVQRKRRLNCGCYFAEWQEGTSSGNADKEREYSIMGGLVTA